MFKVPQLSKKSRKKQRGVRDIKITKWKCFCKAFFEAFKSFCTTSSFVPLRFVFGKKRHKIDIILWISVMIVLMVLTITFVQDFLIKFESMSTTTYVQTNHQPTSLIPFPSITVCATSIFSYTKVYGFMHNYIIRNPDLKSSVNLTKILKAFTLIDASQSDLEEMDIVLNTYNITMKDVYYYTSQSCNELFQLCRWDGVIRPCDELFKISFGGGSFCCSFNYPLAPSIIEKKNFLKTTMFGMRNGLSFIAKPIRDKFYYHTNYGSNLRIILHHYSTFPMFNENDVFAPLGKETTVEIDSVYNIADEKVRQLEIPVRDCVFNWEMQLEHFPIYSYANCILNCRISKIIRACGCATYFLPSVNATLCPKAKLFCIILNYNLDIKTKADGTMVVQDCYCPDDCVVLKLHHRVQSVDFLMLNSSVDEFYKELIDGSGIVHIDFSKSITKLLQRQLILNEIQLASNVGGIIALFLGCSFISIFEISYFLSIRLYANYRRLCIQNCLVKVPMYLE